jgi:DNA polymerase-3 subunit delta'
LIQSFQHVLARGRLAHAYLFVGHEGIGKKLFATELAKTLLCENPPEGELRDPCDACPACLQIAAGSHPDFQLAGLEAEQHEFPIKRMQEIIEHLNKKPARGKHRILILDDADQLSEEAANCFLKTLEEPPPSSLLILIGSSADLQMPTIRSRCQLIRFRPLPEELLAERLVAQEIVTTPEEARRIAPLCKGSLGAARLLADPAVLALRQELSQTLARPDFDSVALGQRIVKFVEEDTKDSALKRDRARIILEFVVDHLRQTLHADTEQADRLADALDRTLAADYQVDRRLQLVLVLEAWADGLGKLMRG